MVYLKNAYIIIRNDIFNRIENQQICERIVKFVDAITQNLNNIILNMQRYITQCLLGRFILLLSDMVYKLYNIVINIVYLS